MPNNVRIRTSVDGNAKAELKGISDAWHTFKKQGADGLGIGVGITAASKAFGLLDSAISGVIDVTVDAIKKAQEEQAGIAKLDASLRANINGWDGNRDAIEGVIASREKLAFSDGEQRDALAVLVTRTHDVTKALSLERQAMDLARLKGISLADASTIIGKVYSGNVGILQRYGIAVSKGATGTQALAEIQKASAGQAQAYADTTQGTFESLAITVDDLKEQVGTALLPVLKDLAAWARDDLVPALSVAVKWIEDNKLAFEGLGYTIDAIIHGPAEAALNYYKKKQAEAADAAIAANIDSIRAWDTGSERIGSAADDAGAAIISMGDDATAGSAETTRALDKIIWKATDVRDKLDTLGKSAADAYYDPLIAGAQHAATLREIAEQKAIIASKHSTKAQVEDAKLRLLELSKTSLEEQVALIGYGKMNAGEQKKFLADLKKKWKTATGDAKADIAALIAFIERIPTSRTIVINAKTHKVGTGNDSGHAAGGFIPPYGSSKVGEHGEEILTVGAQGASVNPSAAGWGGGGGFTLNLTVATPMMTPGAGEALAAAIVPHVTKALRRQQVI